MAISTVTEINLDINQPGVAVVHAKQYDTARSVKAYLTYNGVKWNMPESNFVAVVSYKKADRIGGFYDTTEDGIIAVSVDESDRSIVTIALDRQTLTTVGNVTTEITIYDTVTLGRISSFSFIVQVERASLTELDLSSNPYFNVLARDIREVIAARDGIAGMEATANRLAPAALPTVGVTPPGVDNRQTYLLTFGIPTFPGINGSPTVNTVEPTVPASVSVGGGSSGTTPYTLTFNIPKGAKGDAPVPRSSNPVTYRYAASTSAQNPPASGSTSWKTSASSAIVKGKYLWTEATVHWDNGQETVIYTATYTGADGSGAVNSVNSLAGDIVLDAGDILMENGTDTIEDAITYAETARQKVISLSLSATWSGNGPFTQTVTSQITGGTAHTKVDLQPNSTVISALMNAGVKALYISNDTGTGSNVFTAVAVGAKPSSALTIQATLTETE